MEARRGTVQSVVYRNAENGYTVLSMVDEQSGQVFNATGVIPLVGVGDLLELSGSEKQHPRFGRQFAVTEYSRIAPSTTGAIVAFLSSGVVKGIGESLAKTIVDKFGDETLKIMENEPQKLLQVRGIGVRKCAAITASFAENRVMREVLLALEPYGVTVGQAYKLYRCYGDLCLAKILEDPYRMIRDIDGIGFVTADRIAQSMAGFETDSLARLRAGLQYALSESSEEYGHTFLPREKLILKASALLGADGERLDETIDWMADSQELTIRQVGELEAVFLPYLDRLEDGIAFRLSFLADDVQSRIWDLPRYEKELSLTLSDEQKRAVTEALNSGVMVITGGPGTGKTTIIRFIAYAMDEQGLSVQLAAPTGRAAKRMTEATGFEASTIHRLLEYNPSEGFVRNDQYPLDGDIIIIDEMSMVDVPLMAALLRAIPKGTRLILVGDRDQLPPVGCGDVLCDIIDSGVIPVMRLNEIFRQAQSSLIVTNAHRINDGLQPVLDRSDSDFVFESMLHQDSVLDRVVELCRTRMELLGTSDPLMDVQVLVPMKKGILGVGNLNKRLQAALNPPSPAKRECVYGDTVFREGDKIMQVKNNYKVEWEKRLPNGAVIEGSGAFNGDLGTLMGVDFEARKLSILFDDDRACVYDFVQAEELDLAYCISIHKSQGSEYNTVLLPLSGGPPQLLTRNLLYTAVTRAKKLVYCLGSADIIRRMVNTTFSRRRYTSLAQRLKETAN
ncbi:MAG TPA: ATP-dependent RecD-like DNA helicase [Eubacteriales bacterium]|nr:ATP-dependent RecD-like DNA helicase [Clostridia bacterium]HPF54645.1 ATP-dependent RecD-like DNA helicase [Clostridia bacterium]HRV73567.1 ATP-dependent RecD-like DNA helicase [Eubacteriales bacterium]